MAGTIRDEHLAVLARDLEAITAEIRATFAGLSPEQLGWKPSADRWSILECFEHLRVAGELYHRNLRRAIEAARDRGLAPRGPYRSRGWGRLLNRFAGDRSPKAMRAPGVFRPEVGIQDPTIIDRFLEQEQELADLIELADGCDLNKVKLPSPVTWLIRLSIGDALTLLVNHQKRHLGQAQRVMETPEFPQSSSSPDTTPSA